jgi:hypothetical protein
MANQLSTRAGGQQALAFSLPEWCSTSPMSRRRDAMLALVGIGISRWQAGRALGFSSAIRLSWLGLGALGLAAIAAGRPKEPRKPIDRIRAERLFQHPVRVAAHWPVQART